MRFDNNFALKHANAYAFLLSRLKRPKQRTIDKIPAHAATIVRHRQNHPTIAPARLRSEEHTSELQSRRDLVCRLLLEKKKNNSTSNWTIVIVFCCSDIR